MHDDMYHVKFRQPDTLYRPGLSKHLMQIRVHHAMFKVTSITDFRPYLKSFSSIERYTRWMEGHLTDLVTN